MKYELSFLLAICCLNLSAQNLVKNSSFERFRNGLPIGVTLVSGSPDFSIPSKRFFEERLSVDGKIWTKEGVQYPIRGNIGANMYSPPHSGHSCIGAFFGPELAEVFQVQLSTPLEAQQLYHISLWVRRSPTVAGDTAIQFVPVYLTPRQQENRHFAHKINTPYYELWPETASLQGCDTTWRKVSMQYVARGGEQFVIIGALGNANQEILEHAPYTLASTGGTVYALYYHFDDLVVEKIPPSADFNLVLDHVFFATGSDSLLRSSVPALNSLVELILSRPSSTVEIVGHTDDQGSEEDNLALSARRAKAIQEYLEFKEISSDRISATGKGEADPMVSNATREGRSRNRRVEVIIRSGD